MSVETLPFRVGLGLDAAQSWIVEIAAKCTLAHETVPLETALDRILAHAIVAPRDVPGYTNSAMDGFALRATDLPVSGEKTFRLAGEIMAGGREVPSVDINSCVRITTGAPLPGGADTVVMKENTRSADAAIWIAAGTAAGANVRAADEDYRAGDLALQRGAQLTPAQLGVLASFGLGAIEVVRRPRAILLTTGDELTGVGVALGLGRIYDSNRYSLGALMQQHGVELLRHERLHDDPALLRDALIRAGDEADIIVSSGGVSAGEADFMPRLIAECGKVYFWKVRIKPGWPFLFGRVGRALAFALPGNPVSGIATFSTLVKPALAAMSGFSGRRKTLRARLTQTLHKRHARAEFQRARLACDEAGTLHATPLKQQGSGMLRGLAEADALIVLPEPAHTFAIDEIVEVMPLPGWPAR